jgi:hypothetical protein
MHKAFSFFLGIYSLLFIILFIFLKADPVFLYLSVLPLGGTFVYFCLNTLRLSWNLHILCILWCSCEWFATYGKFGLALPVYLLFVLIDLRNRFPNKIGVIGKILFVICLIYATHFIVTAAGLLQVNSGTYMEIYNASACALLPLTLFTFYIYFICTDLKAELHSTGQFVLPYLFLLILFSLIRHYEYLYAYNGDPKFILHPELLISQYFITAWLTIQLVQRREKVKALLLIISAWIFLPRFSISQYWKEGNYLPVLNGNTFWHSVFGFGYKWKILMKPAFEYTAGQFPLPLTSILTLEGGYLLTLLFLAFLIVIFKNSLSGNLISSLIILLVVAAAFYFPVMRDPLSMLILAFTAASSQKMEKYKHSLTDFHHEKYLLRMACSILLLCFLYLGYQGFSAFLKIRSGPRFPVLDTAFTIPRHFMNGLLASEDVMFFSHTGVDFARMKQVFLQSLEQGQFIKGASSLSMQLAKVQYLEFDRTIPRKIQQIFIAVYLEKTKTKSEILQEYLAAVPYAPDIRGLNQAAASFFGKIPADLNYVESLKIIMSIPDPASYNASLPLGPKELKIMESIKERALEFRGMLNKIQERL